MPLEPGDKAPDFTLLDQNGEQAKLSDYKGRKVLVSFYPQADTPGCTQQSCGLRDIAGQVGDTAIIGISPDQPKAQAKFDQKYGLGFPLLVGKAGFEPATSASRTLRANQAALLPGGAFVGCAGGDRT